MDKDKKVIIFIAFTFLLAPSVTWAKCKGKDCGFGGKFKDEIKSQQQEQKAENKTFRESLKGKTAEEKAAAIKTHHQEQFQENVEFRDKIQQDKITALQEKLSGIKKLSDEDKAEILKDAQENYSENKERWLQRQGENVAYVDSISNDANLTSKEKKAKMKEYFKQRKEENKQYREQQKAERKQQRQEMKEKIKSQIGNTETK